MKSSKLVEALDDEYSKQFADIVACKNAGVSYMQSEVLLRELLLKLLIFHGYKKTRSQLAKLGRKFSKLNRGIHND